MPFGAESGNEQWRRKATLCCSGSLYPSLHPSQTELAKEKKSVRFGRKEWNRAASHGAACGYDCGDGHRGRSHLPASVGLPPLLLTWLSFPPPWWPVMAHTLHHHHARLQLALLLRAIACQFRELFFFFPLSHEDVLHSSDSLTRFSMSSSHCFNEKVGDTL